MEKNTPGSAASSQSQVRYQNVPRDEGVDQVMVPADSDWQKIKTSCAGILGVLAVFLYLYISIIIQQNHLRPLQLAIVIIPYSSLIVSAIYLGKNEILAMWHDHEKGWLVILLCIFYIPFLAFFMYYLAPGMRFWSHVSWVLTCLAAAATIASDMAPSIRRLYLQEPVHKPGNEPPAEVEP